MKSKLIIIAFILLVSFSCFGQEIFYNSRPTLAWTPPATAPDESDFLTGDTVEYRIYAFDRALGDISTQPIESLSLRATIIDDDPWTSDVNGEETAQISFSSRSEWYVALFATHIDGGGNRTDYTDVLYSSIAAHTADNSPFWYAPLSENPSTGVGPTGLRDTGIY